MQSRNAVLRRRARQRRRRKGRVRNRNEVLRDLLKHPGPRTAKRWNAIPDNLRLAGDSAKAFRRLERLQRRKRIKNVAEDLTVYAPGPSLAPGYSRDSILGRKRRA